MNGIEKQAAYYRGYLIDDRSLAPLTIALATIVGLWLVVYLATSFGPLGAVATFAKPHPAAHGSIIAQPRRL